jgi:hypothetical protein
MHITVCWKPKIERFVQGHAEEGQGGGNLVQGQEQPVLLLLPQVAQVPEDWAGCLRQP